VPDREVRNRLITMEDRVWHIRNDLTKVRSKDVLNGIIKDDKANYQVAESELAEDLQLLDDAIALYIEPLQEAYRRIDEWKGKASLQASIAMAESILNYVLLARHSVLLGYYPEARDLLRGCYERTTRCYLFFIDEGQANKFLAGKRISQVEVDRKLNALESQGQGKTLYEELRSYYGAISQDIHPNLHSFQARYGDVNLKEEVGLKPILGGIMSPALGRVVILRVLQCVLSALKIIGAIFREQSGAWEREYKRIVTRQKEILSKLSSA